MRRECRKSVVVALADKVFDRDIGVCRSADALLTHRKLRGVFAEALVVGDKERKDVRHSLVECERLGAEAVNIGLAEIVEVSQTFDDAVAELVVDDIAVV